MSNLLPTGAAPSSPGAARGRVAIVDLNNFATFPTLAVGRLVASLRRAKYGVEVLCPLAHADFLAAQERFLDRVRCNEFSVPAGTPIYDDVRANHADGSGFRIRGLDARNAAARYENRGSSGSAYRRAKARMLGIVHRINRRPVRDSAAAFDGLM